VIGRKSGHTVSLETRKKLSLSMTGRKCSEQTKLKMKKSNKRLWLGKKFSDEHRKKLSESHKGQIPACQWEKGHIPWNLGKKMPLELHKKAWRTRRNNGNGKPSKEAVEKIRLKLLGRKNTPETIEKMKQSAQKRVAEYGMPSGEKSPNWQGGKTKESTKIRHSLRYKEWRTSVFVRDEFTCQTCGQRGGLYLEAHHKKMFSILLKEATYYFPYLGIYDAAMLYTPLWDINNGITLCEKCHNKTKGK